MSLSPRLIKQAQDVLAARNADFEQLAAIAELDPKRDFVGANLRGVIFQAENLSDFDFREADLVGADLSHAQGVTFEMIERAKFDATTQLPPKMQSSVKKLTHFWKSACPTFVSAFGVDEFGQWMEFEIADVIQRLRWIPSGKFWMGSQVTEWGRYRDEGPRHEVMIGEGFWLFDTTCTNALWQAVMGREPSWLGVADRPVENISWKDAQRFIAIVNDLVPGLDLALPSEAHWEYACRAGTVTPFSFGETITLDQVNYDSRREKTVPVASLPPNAWGLYEMHGNVREWVGDAWHDRYVRAPRDGSVWDKAESTKRVLRGGSWKDRAVDVRSAFRLKGNSKVRFSGIGLRCARVQDGAEPVETRHIQAERRIAAAPAGGARRTEFHANTSSAPLVLIGTGARPPRSLAEAVVLPSSDFDPPAPPKDVEKRARKLVLEGVAPPKEWRPWIKSLDFRRSNLVDAAPLDGLTALTSLNLNRTLLADATPLAGLKALDTLDLRCRKLKDAKPLAALKALTTLDLRDTKIADVTPLAGLKALTRLNLKSTKIVDATPLAGLTALTTLHLGRTRIADAKPLAGLTALTWLDLSYTQITDATPLAGLKALTTLHLYETQIADATPLAGLEALTTLFVDGTQIENAEPLANLTMLSRLALGRTQISDAKPLAGLKALTWLLLSGTQIADARPLSELKALTTLGLSNTQISDAAPLAGLTALTTLYLSNTQITDAAPLAGLTALTTLYLSNTRITDAAPLAGLTALTTLALSGTRITDPTPLASLTALTELDLSGTPITDATPLAGLTALTTLFLTATRITDVTSLAGLTALTKLDLSGTRVTDATPLAGLTALTWLNLDNTQIVDLVPLTGLIARGVEIICDPPLRAQYEALRIPPPD